MPHLSGLQSEKPTVLVVDDQQANLQLVGDLLTTAMGYEVLVANNGQQALEQLDSRVPNLILLDVLMPGLSGIETCKRIKEKTEWQDIPIIFLSASDDKTLIVRALETGGVDYVTKPFSRAELLSRVRTHLMLKAARDQLQMLAEDKDELLGMLTHDLKNHLGGMQMSAQLLYDRSADLPDTRSRTLVDNILASTTQMLAFVKEFLANAALERQQQLNLMPVDLSVAMTLALRHYRSSAERKGLQFSYDSLAAVSVMADTMALNQVLENLISNAVKFSPRDTTITLSVSVVDDDYAECRVADEGPGFTETDREKIFRRYVRLSARPTGGEPSTGLGLSIVKRLVDAMKGRLTLESTPGGGAAFTVRLPRAKS
ncbi:MAG TPA: hybrid sensor histidine kinase/response regulator [Verrucomicrobiales bacterium]|jgi:two-component system sensor histidine kinase/response regulator|nr:hybrid sensor histidine kinase/response regulator [Verrucomicrobiales bacterium]